MTDADVIVVGAGPAGSTAAYHLARHGLTVLVLEKSQFPREKVCGDGLTPRAVKQLVKMGVDDDMLKDIDNRIRAQVAEAADYAESSPEPQAGELYTDVLVGAY